MIAIERKSMKDVLLLISQTYQDKYACLQLFGQTFDLYLSFLKECWC